MMSNRKNTPADEREIAAETLRRLAAFFEGKGWLDQHIAIRSKGAGYRLFCSRSEFGAYRINEEWGRPPGVPCWPVCAISNDTVFHDSDLSPFPSGEPTALQWLGTMVADDYELA